MLDSQMDTEEKPGKQLQESGKEMRKASEANPRGDAGGKLYKVIFAFLLLVALLAFVVYCLAVAAIFCRTLNWKEQQQQQQLEEKREVAPEPTPKASSGPSNDTTISSNKDNNSTVRGACNVRVRPFSQLLSASTGLLIIFNSVAALVLLESLMLLPIVKACCGRTPADRRHRRAGSVTSDESECGSKDRVSMSSQTGAAKDLEAVKATTATAFAFSDMEPCDQHTNDFILRLTYKTWCRDHLVIRVKLPTTNPSSMLGFPLTSGFLDETTPSGSASQLVDAKDTNRPDGEYNFAAASGPESGTNRGSGKTPEQDVVRLASSTVRWKTGTNVGRVNETETDSCERTSPRKSRAIH